MKSRVDTENLKLKFNGKQELLKKVYEEFSLHVETVLPEMQAAYEDQDFEVLKERAHTLKGNAALIGANRVRELASEIQEASSNNSALPLPSTLSQLYEEARVALKELDHFISHQLS